MTWTTKAVFEAVCDCCGDDLTFDIKDTFYCDEGVRRAEKSGWFIGSDETKPRWQSLCGNCLFRVANCIGYIATGKLGTAFSDDMLKAK